MWAALEFKHGCAQPVLVRTDCASRGKRLRVATVAAHVWFQLNWYLEARRRRPALPANCFRAGEDSGSFPTPFADDSETALLDATATHTTGLRIGDCEECVINTREEHGLDESWFKTKPASPKTRRPDYLISLIFT
jgi:hypothetical protein